MTTGAPASEQTKVKYSGCGDRSRARLGYASDWRDLVWPQFDLLIVGYFWYAHRQAVETAAAAKVVRPMMPVSAVQRETRRSRSLSDRNRCGDAIQYRHHQVPGRWHDRQNIFYKEGQTVKAGDLLIQIDPRPYQVQLTQAKGQMAKDEATFEDAQESPSSAINFCFPKA